jgi:hypothetical protein
MYLNGDSWYAVFLNSIFMMKYHDTKYFEIKIYCGKLLQVFFVCTKVTLTIIASMPTEAYSSLDLTTAKYSISKLFIVANENVIVWINSSNFIHVRKENQHHDENEVYSQHAHPSP